MNPLHPPARQPALRAALLLLTCLCGSGSARAQGAPDGPLPLEDTWRYTLGLGAVSGPKFPGSDRSKIRVAPVLGASYGRWTIGGGPDSGGEGMGLGFALHRDRHWQWAAGLGLGLGKARKEGDDIRLAGLGDLAGTTRGGLSGRYSDGWFGARFNLSTDVGGKQQGTQAGLDLEARARLSSGLMLSAGPGLRWGDQRYAQAFFGISAAQSAASGRAQYHPAAGLTDVHFSVSANYPLTPQLGLGLRITASELRGDVANSPLAFDPSPTSVALFAIYRF